VDTIIKCNHVVRARRSVVDEKESKRRIIIVDVYIASPRHQEGIKKEISGSEERN